MLDDEDVGISISAEMLRVDKLCTALDNKEMLISRIKKETTAKQKKFKPIKIPNIKDIVEHTRNSDKSTIHYFTKRKKYKQRIRNVMNEPNPFVLPPQNFISNISFKPKRVRKKRKRNDYMKSASDVLNRLYIPDDYSGIPQSKLDYDKEYFTLVKGRPIKETFDKRNFAENHRKCFFKKLCAGFLEDEIKRQEEHHIRDLWHMYNIREELDKIIQSFESYLAEDHQESVRIIEEAQQIAQLKDQKVIELKRSSGYMNAIKCALYKMEEELSYRKYCKEAIYQISPSRWQEEFEASKEAFRAKSQEIAEEVYDHYQEFKLYTPEPDKFLDKLVSDLVSDIINMGPPSIYFQHPWEVDMVFKEFELQNLHAAKHLADVGKIQKNLKNLLKHVREYYKKEFACLQEKIQDLEAGIQYQKERSLELEQIAKELTQTIYRDVVSGDHILETYGLIQNLYDEIIADDETKLTCTEMLELIEEEIANVWRQVQDIDRFKYMEYAEKVEAKTKHEYLIARNAKRREREVVLTIDRLHRSYMPPYRQFWKRLNPRSDPPPMLRRERIILHGKKKKIHKEKIDLKLEKVKLKEKERKEKEEMKEKERKMKMLSDHMKKKLGIKIVSRPSEDSLLESVFIKRFESESSEAEEELPDFPEYKYDFSKLQALHNDLLTRIKNFQMHDISYFENEVEEEIEEEHSEIFKQEFEDNEAISAEVSLTSFHPTSSFTATMAPRVSRVSFGTPGVTSFYNIDAALSTESLQAGTKNHSLPEPLQRSFDENVIKSQEQSKISLKRDISKKGLQKGDNQDVSDKTSQKGILKKSFIGSEKMSDSPEKKVSQLNKKRAESKPSHEKTSTRFESKDNAMEENITKREESIQKSTGSVKIGDNEKEEGSTKGTPDPKSL